METERHEKKTLLANLLNKVEEIDEGEEFGLNAVNAVHRVLRDLQVLEEENPLGNRVEKTDETILDVKLLNRASKIVLKSIVAVDFSADSYKSVDFTNKILKFINLEEDEDEEFNDQRLLKLLDIANNVIGSRNLPTFCPLFGTYKEKAPPKPKAVRQVKEKQAQVEKKQLIRIVTTEKEEQGIDDTVSNLLEVLKAEYAKNGKKPIDYYRYVIDTESFATTIENIFYTSFLIRDGKARLGEDKATLEPVRNKELKRFRDEGGQNTQMMTAITMDTWKNLAKEPGYLQMFKSKQ